MRYLSDIYKGRTIGRILLNKKAAAHLARLKGRVLDLSGSRKASYYPLFREGIEVVAANIEGVSTVDAIADFNKPLPFQDGEFDAVVFFSALYIAEDPLFTLKEIERVLKSGGTLLLATPFISNEMREPHDYMRPTAEGLQKLLTQVGFREIAIERLGERFTAAAQLLHPVFLFNTVRLFAYSLALVLDRLIPSKIRMMHPTPVGYLTVAKK